jgi:hypothetical protein
MDAPLDTFNSRFNQLIEEASQLDLTDEKTTVAMKNLKTFSECRPQEATPEPESTPEPTTFRGKLKAGVVSAWESETTRVLIKAGGTFAGVALVAYSTINKDHVLERQALAQANTTNGNK